MPSNDTGRAVAESLRDAFVSTLLWLLALCGTVFELAASAVSLLFAWTATAITAVAAGTRTAAERVRGLLVGPGARIVGGPVKSGLFGRRLDVSLVAALLAPVLALATAWWVGSTVGYDVLADWAVGTWTGENPVMLVFVAAGALVGLGAVSAAVNSGLVPTTLLVVAPAFGAGVTRYGTTVQRYGGPDVFSLPEALAFGAFVGLAVGVPLGVLGFVLGVGLRRVVDVLRGDSGPSARPERV